MNHCGLLGDEDVQASIPGGVCRPEFLSQGEAPEGGARIRTLPLKKAKQRPRTRTTLRGAGSDFWRPFRWAATVKPAAWKW